MAIRSGSFVTMGGGPVGGAPYLIDRIQSLTVTPNVPSETIYEVGNQKSTGIIRDSPADLSFDVESYDVTPKFEAIILGKNPNTLSAGEVLDFNTNVPLNILAPVRASTSLFNITGGVIVPYLFLQQVAYRFGVKQDAQQTFTFKGDSIFYGPVGGVPFEDVQTCTAGQLVFNLTNPAAPYFNNTLGATQYVLSVTVYNPDGSFYRLFNGTSFDYTDAPGTYPTPGSIVLNSGVTPIIAGAMIRMDYFYVPNGTSVPIPTVPQAANDADGFTVKPAALKAKNIDVYVGTVGTGATPLTTFALLSGVQTIDYTWSVNLEQTTELGNPLAVSEDYVVPAVNGTLTTRPYSTATWTQQLGQLLDVPAGQVIGMLSGEAHPMLINLNDPNSGETLKSVYVPDAIFDPPDVNARANQLMDWPWKFYSNTGTLFSYNGASPWSADIA